jgi:hypothetical protein
VVEVGIFEMFHGFVIIDLKSETGSGKRDALCERGISKTSVQH